VVGVAVDMDTSDGMPLTSLLGDPRFTRLEAGEPE
jgi:hypothetical protein